MRVHGCICANAFRNDNAASHRGPTHRAAFSPLTLLGEDHNGKA